MPKRRKNPLYKKWLTGSEVERALAIEEALRKAKEPAPPKKPAPIKYLIPATLGQVPNKMYHFAKRILRQEKNTNTRLVELRKRFEEYWGFSVDKIAHLFNV